MKWHLESRKLSSLKEYEKNPRQLSKSAYAQLKRSLEKFGLVDKPIINRDDTIIGGHQRVKVLRDMGVKEIECYVPDTQLTEKEVQEFCIRLNKNVGSWDWDVLGNEWNAVDLVDFGFTSEELLDSIKDFEKENDNDDDAQQLLPSTNPKTQLGDIYQLGDHRLICGDSTDPTIVSAMLDGAEPTLMVTDPPYGVNYDPTWSDGGEVMRKKRGKQTTQSIGKVLNDNSGDWKKSYELFNGSAVYIWHSGKHSLISGENLRECDYEIICQIIWVKQHFALSRGDYHWQHESCWYAVKKGHKHNWQGARDQSSVWEIANLNAFGKNQEDERTAHSTQKPLECMARPIRNNTAPGESVYDPFLGSGTTLIAAESLNRKCYGIELDPAYCDITVDRWVRYRQKNGKEATVTKNGSPCDDFNG